MRTGQGGEKFHSSKLKVLDLFSGIGGFSLGLERTGGFETAAFCEIDPFCQCVLAKHWPHVPCHEDITKLRGEDVGPVDVVCGGFPCKQTSNAAAIHGRRKLLDGADSGLWWSMLNQVKAIDSSWVVVENPSSKALNEVQASLERAGYFVERLPISAFDCGFPHLRRRVLALAHTDSKRLEIAGRSFSSQAQSSERLAAARGAWLQAVPRTLRAYNGVPDRVDRVGALGNSIPPVMAEMIGHAILAAISEQREAA